ncbi:lipase family protein [Caballeronia mineralivorans]|uniref:lipase family protein n=1 Tax=Caballeronia mineralivorans TaxID=2010198 RepID=UPI000A9A7497|nr:lipase family protein [Caballeronia mineralivorans]
MVDLDGRMICASNWAYAILDAGDMPVFVPFDAACDLTAPVPCFATGSSRIDAAFIGTGRDGVVLAFRGTLPPGSPDHKQTLQDWLNDLEAVLVVGDKLPGRVHQGFLGSLDALWPSVSEAVAEQMASSPVKHLTITGHSKGGAVAHLAAARFALSTLVHGSDITVRTFEGAHPGDQSFADGYMRLVPDVIRYEFQDDLVPHLPPSIMVRRLFKAEPLFAPLMAIDSGVDYAPAGRLQFIDWSGNIQEQSTLLSTERFFRLSEKLAALDFQTIVNDHSIGVGSLCLKAVWPGDISGASSSG